MSDSEILVDGVPVIVHRSMDDAINSIDAFDAKSIISGFAVAINPEKIMAARRDVVLKSTLHSATFRFADGIGIVLALRMKGAKYAVRIPGCEFWIALMQKAGKSGLPVYLVGAKPDILLQVREKLVSNFGTNIVGTQDGYFKDSQRDELIKKIRSSGAKIVTVAMGSPRQELFIAQCRQAYPDAFYMGVGGTYDVFAGNVKRAPSWACNLNIEWLYRLISNPSRIFRQIVLLDYLMLLLRKKL